MGLFKSKDERRIEREMKIRQGMRAIEKSIRQQEKFAEDFIKNAQHARKIGDDGQYLFIRGALKKTAAVKKMLERQLLAIKNAMLIQQQAAASQQFAECMNLMAREIGRVVRRDGPDQDAGPVGAGRRAGRQHGGADGDLPRLDGADAPSPAATDHRARGARQRRRDRPHDPGRRARRGEGRSWASSTSWRARSRRSWGRRSRRIEPHAVP